MKRLLLLLLTCVFTTAIFAQKPTDKRLAGLDTLVNRLLKEWHAAGVGIAVVEKNKVIYAGGFGFRDYENKVPVTGNTLFAIGSCTKAFTSALLGKLQADGKLDFDKKVTTYLPGFQFYNNDLTNFVTVRDITCHRTGLPRHDFSWYLNPASRDSLVERIQYMEPSAELRQTWQYNNWMFLLQGVIAEKLTGKSWEANVQEQIFQPLGMKTSNFTLWDGQHTDASKGYFADKNDVIKPMDYYKIEGMGPAGSIFSSPSEMANWVMMWINGGKFNGQDVLSETYVREAMSSQMVINAALPSKENPDAYLANYGMGWFLSSYRGHYRVEHGGNIDGFSASTSFFPADSIGIVVLVNQDGSPLPGMIRNYLADKMLKLPPRDWHKQRKDAVDKAKAAQKEMATTNPDSLTRKQGTRPSHLLAEYTGNYEHPGYGAISIFAKNDSLFAHSKSVDMWLEHYHYDLFRPLVLKDGFDLGDDNPFRMQFNINTKGEIDGFAFYGVQEGVKDIIFKKKAVAVEVATSELEKYVGDYEVAGIVARVYLRAETLTVQVPGQPDYETTPIGNHEFKFKMVDGYSVRFEVTPEGKVTAMFFIQPNGTFKATRK